MKTRITYTKTGEKGRVLECEIREHHDGSVSILGEGVGGIHMFEFCDDALERAIQHVTECGFVRVDIQSD